MKAGRILSVTFALAFAGLFAACSGVGKDGAIVGGACSTESECDDDSLCLIGGDFPSGTCSKRCTTHEDCPGGTRCIDESDFGNQQGVCLLECEIANDCRGGYTCKGEENHAGGGESLTCIAA